MAVSRVIGAGLAGLALLASSAHAADEYVLTLSDGSPLKVMGDKAIAVEKAKSDFSYAAKFPRSLAEISDQYVYAFAAQAQVAAKPSGAPGKGRSLPMGGFDVVMNGTDLAVRAAGGAPLLPFSRTFQWTGVGLGLAGMLLNSGAQANEENVQRLKMEMDWYNKPYNFKIKIVEEVRQDDDRLNDRATFQRGQLEATERVLIDAGIQDPTPATKEALLYPGVRFEAPVPAKVGKSSNIMILGAFANPKSVWMTGRTGSEIHVTTVNPALFVGTELRKKQVEEMRMALATHAPSNWYWIWTEQVDGKAIAHIATVEREVQFDAPPKGDKYQEWLKAIAQPAPDAGAGAPK